MEFASEGFCSIAETLATAAQTKILLPSDTPAVSFLPVASMVVLVLVLVVGVVVLVLVAIAMAAAIATVVVACAAAAAAADKTLQK